MHWNDGFDYGATPEEKAERRRAFVSRELARMPPPDDAEHPLVAERKARERAARLAQMDARDGVYRACTLGAPPPPETMEPPRWEAGGSEDDGSD